MADKDTYVSYGGFLRTAIRRYWGCSDQRVNFLALLLATRQSWKVAWGELTSLETGKKVLKGAAGAAALAVLLRLFVGGPVGLLLTAGSIASLVTLYVRSHEKVWARVGVYQQVILEFEGRYERLQEDHVSGRVDAEQLELMVDGLLNRFLAKLDELADADESARAKSQEQDIETGSTSGLGSFAEHVSKQRDP